MTIIAKKTSFINDPAIDSFHYTMFHGLVGGQNAMPTAQAQGLAIELNAYRINEIIMPKVKLVVSARIKNALSEFPHLRFEAASITKIFVVPYQEGVFFHWEDPNYTDDGEGPVRVIQSHQHREDLRDTVPPFFEMNAPRLLDVSPAFTKLIDIDLKVGSGSVPKPFTCSLSSELLLEYPILWHSGFTIFSTQAFGSVEKTINWNYFLRADFEV